MNLRQHDLSAHFGRQVHEIQVSAFTGPKRPSDCGPDHLKVCHPLVMSGNAMFKPYGVLCSSAIGPRRPPNRSD